MVNAAQLSGSLRPDQAGSERLIRTIHAETNRRVRDLSVNVLNGRVIVNGTCHSYHVKQLVTRAVFTAMDRATLVNQVAVARG